MSLDAFGAYLEHMRNGPQRKLDKHTENLSIRLVGMDTMHDGEGEFSFCQILCESFIRRVLKFDRLDLEIDERDERTSPLLRFM